MARKKIKDIFAADNTQNTDATQAAAPPVEKETRRQRKKRQANMTLEEMTAETDKQLFGDKLEPNLSRNSVPDVIPEGEPKSDRYKTVISQGPEKERIVTRTKEEEGTGTGTAITNAMSNTAVTNGGSLYDKAVADNPDMTFEETQELAGKLATADQEKENVEADADAVIGEKVNEVISDVEGATDGAVEGDGDMEQGGTEGLVPNAQSQTLMGIGGGGDGTQGPPDYESETDVNKVKKDIAQANQLAAGRDAYVPQAVVEQLGVQDYFPTMGRDIAKGTWTGSVLGSQTVYAGGGMVLPMGLYDARKRALNQAAKEKQAMIDKILDLPNTIDQANLRYQDYGNEFVNEDLQKYGSYAAMVADPEFRRKMTKYKNIGKELTYVDKWVDEKIKDLGNPAKYVPKEIVEDLYKFKSGIIENFDEVLQGEGDVPQMINNLRSFESGIALVDNLVKEGIFDENRLDQAPISLNTGAINADPEGWGKFQDDMLRVINKDGSIDNDTYVTGLMKFFDTSKAEGIIDGLFQGNLDERTRGSVLKYLLSQAPKKIVYDYQSMGNQSARRAADAMENQRFYAGMAERRRERETYYQHLNKQMNTPDAEGKTVKTRIEELKKIKDPVERRNALIAAGNKYNLGTPIFDPYSGAVAFTRAPSKELKGKTYRASGGQGVKIQVYDPKAKGADSKGYVKKIMTVNQLININTNNMTVNGKPKYKYSDNGGALTADVIKGLKTSNDKITYSVNSLGAVNTVYNKNTKSWETLTDKNWNQFDAENSAHVERYEGTLQYFDTKTGTYKNTRLQTFTSHDFKSDNGQASRDSEFGDVGEEMKGQLNQDYSSSSYSGGNY